MKAKKSLGQNWLTSKVVAQKMLAAAKLTDSDTALEIGPGQGFLTELLLEKAGKVVAIEKDDRLIGHLQERFESKIGAQKLILIHGDIVDKKFGHPMSKLLGEKYKLVANIPYYLTGLIIRRFLEAEIQPELMVLMLQKEVAKRIVARDGKESLSSISVKVYGVPKLVATVPADNFQPRPKVDSAILLIDRISQATNFGHPMSKTKFFELLKLGFAHKRKLLKSNLACSTELLEQAKIEPKARPENLTLAQWLHLTTLIIKSSGR